MNNADSAHRDNILKWGKAETSNGGLYSELLDVDILLNCAYLSGPTSPFLSHRVLEKTDHTRRLIVIVDVSCDNLNPFNPLPIYSLNTTLEDPTLEVQVP
jgi:saccharopine dehydrogenase (NAD+, L-lysine-forming)